VALASEQAGSGMTPETVPSRAIERNVLQNWQRDCIAVVRVSMLIVIACLVQVALVIVLSVVVAPSVCSDLEVFPAQLLYPTTTLNEILRRDSQPSQPSQRAIGRWRIDFP
jgi:hypothetical protein